LVDDFTLRDGFQRVPVSVSFGYGLLAQGFGASGHVLPEHIPLVLLVSFGYKRHVLSLQLTLSGTASRDLCDVLLSFGYKRIQQCMGGSTRLVVVEDRCVVYRGVELLNGFLAGHADTARKFVQGHGQQSSPWSWRRVTVATQG
jgi:hypothetical protein